MGERDLIMVLLQKALTFCSLAFLAASCGGPTKIKLEKGSTLSVKKDNVNCEYKEKNYTYRCTAAGVITTLSGRTRDWSDEGICYTEIAWNMYQYPPHLTGSDDFTGSKTKIVDHGEGLLCHVVVKVGYN